MTKFKIRRGKYLYTFKTNKDDLAKRLEDGLDGNQFEKVQIKHRVLNKKDKKKWSAIYLNSSYIKGTNAYPISREISFIITKQVKSHPILNIHVSHSQWALSLLGLFFIASGLFLILIFFLLGFSQRMLAWISSMLILSFFAERKISISSLFFRNIFLLLSFIFILLNAAKLQSYLPIEILIIALADRNNRFFLCELSEKRNKLNKFSVMFFASKCL